MVLHRQRQHTADILDLFATPSPSEPHHAERTRSCQQLAGQAQAEVTALRASGATVARAVLASVAREHGLEGPQARALARTGIARLRGAGALAGTSTESSGSVETIMARIAPMLAEELGVDPDHTRVVALAQALAAAAADREPGAP